VRAREDARGDLMRCRHRLSKLLLRHGVVYWDGKAWTGAHETWLRRQQFSQRGVQLAFDAAWEAMLLTRDRRDQLDKAIAEMATDSEYTAVVRRLGCLRGISTLTAFGLAMEIGDWHRFTGATIGAFLGLVPTESSSGSQRSQGSITKTGNGHAPPAGRGRLAPPTPLPHHSHHAGPVEPRLTRGPGPRPRRQPPAASALAGVDRAQQETRDRQRRRGPGTSRLVLVPGHPRQLTHEQPGGQGGPDVAAHGATRETTMSSNPLRDCHARPC
jgi:hypothetical protein